MTRSLSLPEFLLVATAIHSLLGRERVFRPVRRRLPAAVQSFLACPRCSGFWIGLALWPVSPWSARAAWPWALMAACVGLVGVAVLRSWMDLGVEVVGRNGE